uniref:Pep3/Vps18 RING C-terminal domain-containing protein n=1 Tax=Grammatophora oceanica TaxID=210454 RepID=A0A7S1YDZ5_9STRA
MRVSKLNDDSVICTMIGAWLAELYLHERERGQQQQSAAPLNPFLSVNVDNMDAKTIMRILSSHNVSAEECAAYAAASGNVGTAVHAALSVGDPMSGAHDALRLLNEAPFETAETYYYLHASTLLSRAPLASSKSFLSRYSRGLSPTKLLPSYMHYEKQREEWRKRSGGSSSKEKASRQSFTVEGGEAPHHDNALAAEEGVEIRMERVARGGSLVDDETASITYLEGVIKLGCRDSAIFSYLISLYVAMEDEEPLWKFLTTHVPAASAVADATKRSFTASQEDLLSSPLDMSYTLRTILSTGRHFRSAIRVYMGFGMRQQAVELALKVDPTLARDMAGESTDPEEQKRLWLMIARNAAGDSRGSRDVVAKVVAVLKDCGPDILSIEDVLPFLPDFCQIDEIKVEICEALTSYSSKIEGFLKEMNECDQSCAALRDEIGRLTTHRMQMKADARCALTNKLVLNASEPFYVFPSGYIFLASALKKEVIPYLNDKQHRRVDELEQMLSSSSSSSKSSSKTVTNMQAELDGLIAAECPLTGSIMVDSIDCGFPDSLEVGQQATSSSSRDRGDSVSVITSSTGHGEFVGVRMG